MFGGNGCWKLLLYLTPHSSLCPAVHVLELKHQDRQTQREWSINWEYIDNTSWMVPKQKGKKFLTCLHNSGWNWSDVHFLQTSNCDAILLSWDADHTQTWQQAFDRNLVLLLKFTKMLLFSTQHACSQHGHYLVVSLPGNFYCYINQMWQYVIKHMPFWFVHNLRATVFSLSGQSWVGKSNSTIRTLPTP